MADFAPPGSLVFVEAKLRPTGAMKSNLDAASRRITGRALGEFVLGEIEKSAGDAERPLDFDREVEPWLGEVGAVAFERLVSGELSEPLIAVQTTDPEATEKLIAERANAGDEDADYAGVDFKVSDSGDRAIGLIDDALVLAAGEREFKTAVDAAQGDSLADEDRFQETVAVASDASFADAYVDIGGILEQSDDRIDPRVRGVLRGAGLDPSEATAVASLIPRSEQIEIDVSSDLAGREAPDGDVSELLGSLPASSLAAFAFADFGEQLEEAVDGLDEAGIPDAIGPGELKAAFAQTGVNLERVAGSLESAAVFVSGKSREELGGALVLSGRSSEAADAIAGLGQLLRGARVPGITAVTGRGSGFSIRSRELGEKPLVVLGKGNRVSIGYGLGPALTGIAGNSAATLAGTAGFKAAKKALGNTPISGYVDGPSALRLAEALVPRTSGDFWNAVPYLKKIDYIGVGSGSEDGVVTARLIAGLR